MEIASSLQLRPEYSIPIFLISLLVYVPHIPFIINYIQYYLGCSLTALAMVIYFILSVDLTIKEDILNGVLHVFSALLGYATSLMLCRFGEVEVEAWVRDLELVVTS